jgi:hypothetical protein
MVTLGLMIKQDVFGGNEPYLALFPKKPTTDS